MAESTAIGARRYTSAKCAVAHSTTVTVTRLRSAGGRSATQSPTCRSIHFAVCVLSGTGAAVAVTVAQAPSSEIAITPHTVCTHRITISVGLVEVRWHGVGQRRVRLFRRHRQEPTQAARGQPPVGRPLHVEPTEELFDHRQRVEV